MAVGNTHRPSVYSAILLTPILLLLYAWAQEVSIDNQLFLIFFYFSFFFLGLATFLLVSTNIEHVSKGLRRMFYAVTLIALGTTLFYAFSIATVPRGGERHSVSINPNDVRLTLNYGSGVSGYYGTWEQRVFYADYSVGEVSVDYFLEGASIFVHKNVTLTGQLVVTLELLPNQYLSDTVLKMAQGTIDLDGNETAAVLEPSDWFTIFWGGYNYNQRIRLDKGYSVLLLVSLSLEGSDQGYLDVIIPLNGTGYPSVNVADVEVTSQLNDGIAMLLLGAFFAVQGRVLAKSLMRYLMERRRNATMPAKPAKRAKRLSSS